MRSRVKLKLYLNVSRETDWRITVKYRVRNDKGLRDFPGAAVVKNLPAKAGDTGSIPGPRRPHMLRSN